MFSVMRNKTIEFGTFGLLKIDSEASFLSGGGFKSGKLMNDKRREERQRWRDPIRLISALFTEHSSVWQNDRGISHQALHPPSRSIFTALSSTDKTNLWPM